MARRSFARMYGQGSMYQEKRAGHPIRYVAQVSIGGKMVRRFASTRERAFKKLRELQPKHRTSLGS
jgi:hypothetical protein